jgi:hypothetical protein
MTGSSTGKYIFAEGLHRMWSIHSILIFPLRLFRKSSLILPTLLFRKHNNVGLMLCVDSITDIIFPEISLVSDPMP